MAGPSRPESRADLKKAQHELVEFGDRRSLAKVADGQPAPVLLHPAVPRR